ncbi:hypothetical protein [Agromyces bauzanensis]|nr:hypothetical protein [Agromyces bauzanensis]
MQDSFDRVHGTAEDFGWWPAGYDPSAPPPRMSQLLPRTRGT